MSPAGLTWTPDRVGGGTVVPGESRTSARAQARGQGPLMRASSQTGGPLGPPCPTLSLHLWGGVAHPLWRSQWPACCQRQNRSRGPQVGRVYGHEVASALMCGGCTKDISEDSRTCQQFPPLCPVLSHLLPIPSSPGCRGLKSSASAGTPSQLWPTCSWRLGAWSSRPPRSAAGTWAARSACGIFATPTATTSCR